MKVTTGVTTAAITREFTIAPDGAPVLGVEYSVKKFRVARGVITYRWTPDGWVVKNRYSIDVEGPFVKKDGTDGAQWHNRHPDDEPGTWKSPVLVLAPGWEWLQKIIDELRPHNDGVPCMTVLVDHEIES